MGKVVNLKREQFDVRIDRRSEWGNPFVMVNEYDRADVIDEYRSWLWNEIRRGRWTLSELAALSDKRLGCHCAPKPCHGDVLLRAAQWAANELHNPERSVR